MSDTNPITVAGTIRGAFSLFTEKHRTATVWKLSFTLLAASLIYAFYNLATQGHAAFNTSSDGITWGLQILTYAFFVLTSTGLTFVASMAMVFGSREYYPIAKRCIWLAVMTLVAGFASLGLELGHPFRLPLAIATGLQFRSPMFWMGTFYSVYLAFLLLKFVVISRGDWDSKTSKLLGIASFVVVVLAHGMLGGVFGSQAMRPAWFGPLVPLYFLLTAALSGAAFAVLITYLAYGSEQAMPDKVRSLMRGAMPKAFAAVLGIVIVATVSRTAIGLWSNADGLQVWQHTLQSPWFWIESVLMLLAFAMLLRGGSALLPALLVIVALFIGRYEFVIGGQLVPLFKGTWVHGLIEYAPSLTEWSITLMAFALTFAGWALGERLFNLSAVPPSLTDKGQTSA